jgi:hypothetical protein
VFIDIYYYECKKKEKLSQLWSTFNMK